MLIFLVLFNIFSKTLDSIMKLDLIKDLPSEEIKKIWITYLEEKSRVAGMLTVGYF